MSQYSSVVRSKEVANQYEDAVMAEQEDGECLIDDDKTKCVEEGKEEEIMVVSGQGEEDEI